jgi:hypothetical protein
VTSSEEHVADNVRALLARTEWLQHWIERHFVAGYEDEENRVLRKVVAVLVYRAGGSVNLTPGELKGVTDEVRIDDASLSWDNPVSVWLERP